MIELTKNMSGSISEELQKIGLPEHIADLTDTHIEQLWTLLADIPCNWSEEGHNLVPIEGIEESTKEPCLDEDFFIWKRGTTQMEVWEWFDEHHKSRGLYYLHSGEYKRKNLPTLPSPQEKEQTMTITAWVETRVINNENIEIEVPVGTSKEKIRKLIEEQAEQALMMIDIIGAGQHIIHNATCDDEPIDLDEK